MKKYFLLCFVLVAGLAKAQQVQPAENREKEVVYESLSPILNFDLTVDLNAINFEDIAKTEGKNYALIIAVQDYTDKAITKLDNPISDASKLQKTLNTYYTFDPEYTTFLKNPKRTDLIIAFEKMAAVITPKDNLLIFYAGHGYFDEKTELGYWLPADAVRKDRSSWFPNTILRDYIRGIQTKHTLLIADACFSGGIFKTRALANASKAIQQAYELPSRRAITSGALNEVPDKSVFMEYLVKRLEQNNSPFLLAENLFSSLKYAVMGNSSISQVPQYGEISGAGNEGGDFVFIRKKR
jgi:hypothetical protein